LFAKDADVANIMTHPRNVSYICIFPEKSIYDSFYYYFLFILFMDASRKIFRRVVRIISVALEHDGGKALKLIGADAWNIDPERQLAVMYIANITAGLY